MYQELELFATSDARGDATVVMGESAVSQLSDADWKKLALLLPLSDAETASLPALSRGKRPVGLDLAASEEDLLAEDDVEEEEEDEEEEDEDDNEDEYGPGSAAYAAELKAEEKANAKFCSEWLNVAVRSIVALLLRQVLEIPRLDECGAAQLITDLDYFSNVSSYLATYLPTYLPTARHIFFEMVQQMLCDFVLSLFFFLLLSIPLSPPRSSPYFISQCSWPPPAHPRATGHVGARAAPSRARAARRGPDAPQPRGLLQGARAAQARRRRERLRRRRAVCQRREAGPRGRRGRRGRHAQVRAPVRLGPRNGSRLWRGLRREQGAAENGDGR